MGLDEPVPGRSTFHFRLGIRTQSPRFRRLVVCARILLHSKIEFRLVEDTTNLNSTFKVNSTNHCKETSYEHDFRYAFDGNPLLPSSSVGLSPFRGSQAKNSIPHFRRFEHRKTQSSRELNRARVCGVSIDDAAYAVSESAGRALPFADAPDFALPRRDRKSIVKSPLSSACLSNASFRPRAL